MPIYPGDPGFRRDEVRSMAKGDDLTLSRLDLGSHTGTHVDAPSHFIPGGPTLDQTPLENLVGPARVLDLRRVKGAISVGDLEAHGPRRGDRLLLRTSNSELWARETFQPEFVHLSTDAARLLAERGVRTVGVDYLSVEGFGVKGAPVHHALLGAGMGIIEGLNLLEVPPGNDYRLFCLPLRVMGTEGAPARAVLLPA